MLRKATIVVGIGIALGSCGLSAGASARSGRHDGHGGSDSFRGSRFHAGFAGIHGDSVGRYADDARSVNGQLRGYGSRDVWSHWGSYYGPMIPTI